jgi:hypothetical protein
MVAPLRPHRVQRAERRSTSLEALAPHRMMSGTSAVGERCWHRWQWTHSHGVTRRRSARAATVVVAVGLISKASRHSHRPESTRPSCPAGCVPLHREAVPEFRFIPPCSPKPAKAVPAGAGFDGYRVQAQQGGLACRPLQPQWARLHRPFSFHRATAALSTPVSGPFTALRRTHPSRQLRP